MKGGTTEIQTCLWSDEESAGTSSLAESFLGTRGKRLPNCGGMERLNILRAIVFDYAGKEIWFGDIDIEEAGRTLLILSEALGPLYLLDEIDGKFLSRKPSPHFIKHIATVVIEGGYILYSADLATRLGIIRKTEERQTAKAYAYK
jgi:hypothetical protein